jgi:hypothetical protein
VNADPHVLVVPDSPDQAMTVEHPPGCPQHGHVEPVRTVDGGYACPFEEHGRGTGLEATFYREDYKVPLFGGGMFPVRPGRHPVEIGLRLAVDLEAHAARPLWHGRCGQPQAEDTQTDPAPEAKAEARASDPAFCAVTQKGPGGRRTPWALPLALYMRLLLAERGGHAGRWRVFRRRALVEVV